jgi:hypothetical protein
MGQIIIAISGRKQSGKGTLCNFLKRNAEELFSPDPDSIARDFNDKPFPIVTVGQYSMAGPLKKVCIEMLGLSHEQVYGTDEQKDTLTRYKWEDMSFYAKMVNTITERHNQLIAEWTNGDINVETFNEKSASLVLPKGFMTARQIMQTVGTEIFRCMYANIHTEAFTRAVRDGGERLVVNDDVRFINEVEAVQAMGGYVVRLTRCPYPDDKHASETSLDPDKFDWSKFDHVIDNANMTVDQTIQALVTWLRTKGLLANHT